MLNLNDSFGVRTRQIPRLSPNGRNRRYFAVGARVSEGPESTLLGHSAFAPGMALSAPEQPFTNPPEDRLMGVGGGRSFGF